MHKPAKILMVIENCPVPADSRVWAEAVALHNQGYEVTVIGPKGDTYDTEKYVCLNGIHLYRYTLPSYTNKYLTYVWEYGLSMFHTWWLSLYVLGKHGFDIIHVANPPDMFFILHWFYRLLGKHFIFDQHDLSPEVFQVKFGKKSGFLNRVLLWMEQRSYRASTVVLTTNESQKQVAINRGKCNPDRVYVVRNGPKLDRLQRQPAQPDLKQGFTYLLAYIGAMEVQDGIDYALRAMHELVHSRGRRDTLLVLMGDGGHLPILRQLAHELDIEEYTHFTGWVRDPIILPYLSTADVGLCPDPANGLNEYCTMVKSMEYMAMGLPMVSFDLPETHYTAQDAALYATPNDISEFATQIERLLDDPDLRRDMAQRARILIDQRLNWDYDKQNLLRAYASIFPHMADTIEIVEKDKVEMVESLRT
jgi:glycosyltransferase involved in cell wall biosynthesis